MIANFWAGPERRTQRPRPLDVIIERYRSTVQSSGDYQGGLLLLTSQKAVLTGKIQQMTTRLEPGSRRVITEAKNFIERPASFLSSKQALADAFTPFR